MRISDAVAWTTIRLKEKRHCKLVAVCKPPAPLPRDFFFFTRGRGMMVAKIHAGVPPWEIQLRSIKVTIRNNDMAKQVGFLLSQAWGLCCGSQPLLWGSRRRSIPSWPIGRRSRTTIANAKIVTRKLTRVARTLWASLL